MFIDIFHCQKSVSKCNAQIKDSCIDHDTSLPWNIRLLFERLN